MNMALLAAVAATITAPVKSEVPLERGALTSGNRFESECGETNSTQYTYCIGYSTGMWDIMTLDRGWGICPPEGVQMGQVLKVGIVYMRNNPAKTHLTPGLLLLQSWQEAFPCPKAPKPAQ